MCNLLRCFIKRQMRFGWWLYLSEFSRETEPMRYRYRYRNKYGYRWERGQGRDRDKRLKIAICSCPYGGWEALQSAVCELENQVSQWYNSVQVQRPKNQGATGLSPGVWKPEPQEHWCPRAGKGRHCSSRRERVRHCVPFRPQPVGWSPHPHWWRRSPYPLHRIEGSAFLETPSQVPPQFTSYRLPGHPLV